MDVSSLGVSSARCCIVMNFLIHKCCRTKELRLHLAPARRPTLLLIRLPTLLLLLSCKLLPRYVVAFEIQPAI